MLKLFSFASLHKNQNLGDINETDELKAHALEVINLIDQFVNSIDNLRDIKPELDKLG